MIITSYAQNFEDVILWRALKSVEHGFYIDIGAQDPIEDSVSLLFYEQGWRGVHVEPTATYAAKIRSARPDEEVVEAAIGTGTGLLTFHEFPGTGLSTGDRAIAERHAEEGYKVKERLVPLVSLRELLDRHADKEIHWLKIDVEGMELAVLESWGSSAVRPWIVVVESTLPLSSENSHEKWEPHLKGLGYEFVYFDGLNRFYCCEGRPELKGSFGPGPNVFDQFAFPASSKSAMLAPMRQRLEAVEKKGAEAENSLGAANAEVASLKDRLVTLEADIHSLETARSAEKAAADRMHEAVTSLGNQIAALAEVLDSERHAQRKAEEWRVQAKVYREQLQEIYQSRSWRFTRPCRTAGKAVKKLFRN
jgi:FkbM family methyltransferase